MTPPVSVTFELLTNGVSPDVDALAICLTVLGALTPAQRAAVLAYLNVAPWSNP